MEWTTNQTPTKNWIYRDYAGNPINPNSIDWIYPKDTLARARWDVNRKSRRLGIDILRAVRGIQRWLYAWILNINLKLLRGRK
ncbi:unnamed protein product [marine sediment metagenome]|uniref:Uncharacterized protein n=1 Tax=marine sediment metagenome TaxID=412755 RepID=X0TW82_9ZZZZ